MSVQVVAIEKPPYYYGSYYGYTARVEVGVEVPLAPDVTLGLGAEVPVAGDTRFALSWRAKL